MDKDKKLPEGSIEEQDFAEDIGRDDNAEDLADELEDDFDGQYDDELESDDDEFTPNFKDPYHQTKEEKRQQRLPKEIKLKDGTIIKPEEVPPWEELTKEQKAKRERNKKLLLTFFLVLTICQIAWMGLKTNYFADETAIAAADSATLLGNTLIFEPQGEAKAAIILYPGGQVEHTAYAPLAKELSESGYFVALPKMTFNLAILSSDAATEILEAYPQYDGMWYIAGHSLGGVGASAFALENEEAFEGLILLAAYSQEDLSEVSFDVISITGENDMVLDKERQERYADKLPTDTEHHEIEGGNHSGFGSYGLQEGDGAAGISQTEQRARIVEAIGDFIG